MQVKNNKFVAASHRATSLSTSNAMTIGRVIRDVSIEVQLLATDLLVMLLRPAIRPSTNTRANARQIDDE